MFSTPSSLCAHFLGQESQQWLQMNIITTLMEVHLLVMGQEGVPGGGTEASIVECSSPGVALRGLSGSSQHPIRQMGPLHFVDETHPVG